MGVELLQITHEQHLISYYYYIIIFSDTGNYDIPRSPAVSDYDIPRAISLERNYDVPRSSEDIRMSTADDEDENKEAPYAIPV